MRTKYAPGCYADGAHGHEHVRRCISGLLRHLRHERVSDDELVGVDDILASLAGPMPDDAWDEDAALGILNEYAPDGLVWTLDAGDLLLVANDDAEE